MRSPNRAPALDGRSVLRSIVVLKVLLDRDARGCWLRRDAAKCLVTLVRCIETEASARALTEERAG